MASVIPNIASSNWELSGPNGGDVAAAVARKKKGSRPGELWAEEKVNHTGTRGKKKRSISWLENSKLFNPWLRTGRWPRSKGYRRKSEIFCSLAVELIFVELSTRHLKETWASHVISLTWCGHQTTCKYVLCNLHLWMRMYDNNGKSCFELWHSPVILKR